MSNVQDTDTDTARLAGVVSATCTCCQPGQVLVPHLSLGGTRMACPQTRQTYLDRGDGIYEADGECLDASTELAATNAGAAEQDLLGDRPVRTGPKTRINLERATFAGGA